MDGSPYYGNLIRRRSAGQFVITESAFRAGSALPLHAHASPYFTFTLKGAYSERYGKRSRTCMPGTAVAHPAFEAHSQEFAHSPALLIRVAPDGRESECAIEAALERPLSLRSASIAQAVFRVHEELSNSDASSEMILEGLAYELAGRALLNACATGGSRKRALCMQIFIRASLRAPLSLETLSREIGVSRATLYRDFKSTFRCAPGDYLRRIRLSAAAALLRQTARPVSEIAAECGFFDQSHFDRTFREMWTLSPTQYRRGTR